MGADLCFLSPPWMLCGWGLGAETGAGRPDADGGQGGGLRREVVASAWVATLEMGWMWA